MEYLLGYPGFALENRLACLMELETVHQLELEKEYLSVCRTVHRKECLLVYP